LRKRLSAEVPGFSKSGAVLQKKFDDLHTIIGIAIAPKFADRNAEDFILISCENWTDEHRAHYARSNKGLSFFTSDSLVGRED
jgi:hypothetical protein